MPHHYTRRYRRHRRSMHRRKHKPTMYRERQPKTRIPGQIIPDRMLVSLPYYAHINPTVAASFTQVFQSSAYDPDYTNTGHQPLGYDQWTNFYQNARVVGVTGTMKIINRSDKIWSCVLLYTDDVANTTATQAGSFAIEENPGTRVKVLGLSSGGHDLVTYRVGIKPAQVLGMTKEEYRTSPNTFGTMGNFGTGSNPSFVASAYLFGYTVDGTTPATAVTILADLTYHCELFGRKPVAAS